MEEHKAKPAEAKPAEANPAEPTLKQIAYNAPMEELVAMVSQDPAMVQTLLKSVKRKAIHTTLHEHKAKVQKTPAFAKLSAKVAAEQKRKRYYSNQVVGLLRSSLDECLLLRYRLDSDPNPMPVEMVEVDFRCWKPSEAKGHLHALDMWGKQRVLSQNNSTNPFQASRANSGSRYTYVLQVPHFITLADVDAYHAFCACLNRMGNDIVQDLRLLIREFL